MSAPTLQDIINSLAALSGTEAPDISKESALGIAVAECHLTTEAIGAGKTWAEIAAIRDLPNAVLAKRHHHRLERQVKRELALRANAN